MTLTFRSFLPQGTIRANQQQQRYLQVYPGAQQGGHGTVPVTLFRRGTACEGGCKLWRGAGRVRPIFPQADVRPGLKSACARVVSALNETAPRLYQSLGYKVWRESQVLETEVG